MSSSVPVPIPTPAPALAPANTAAYLLEVGQSLAIRPAPYPTPGSDEVVVRACAIAVNPCDWAMQRYGPTIFPWLELPAVIGEDVAGVVVDAGPAVTRFRVGDRIAGLTRAAFQEYCVVKQDSAAPIPDLIQFRDACVLPLALNTALTSLFADEHLGLRLPAAEGASPPTGETVLITGGATSVGSCAIQLAVAAGYDVITTASAKNFEYVGRLGASAVFDYRSPAVRANLLAAFEGRRCAGAVAIGGVSPPDFPPIIDACAAVVDAHVPADARRFVSLTMVPPKDMQLPEGVAASFVDPAAVRRRAEIGHAVWADFLGPALAAGRFVPAPRAEVVGSGLGAVQEAVQRCVQAVSAAKMVVVMEK